MKVCLLTTEARSLFHFHFACEEREVRVDSCILLGSLEDRKVNRNSNLIEYCVHNSIRVAILDSRDNLVQYLGNVGPDILVLDITTLIGKDILKIPTLGTLNSHSGFLPTYRGFDCRRWAILTKGIVGRTLHWVDSGIDTGNILWRRTYIVRPRDTIKSLARRAYFFGKWQDIAETLKKLQARDYQVYSEAQELEAGKRYYWMHPELRQIVDELLERI